MRGQKLIKNIGSVLVPSGTVTAGVTTYLEILPPCLGIVASLCGIVLSTVLIISSLKKGKLERRLLNLQIAELKK